MPKRCSRKLGRESTPLPPPSSLAIALSMPDTPRLVSASSASSGLARAPRMRAKNPATPAAASRRAIAAGTSAGARVGTSYERDMMDGRGGAPGELAGGAARVGVAVQGAPRT